MRHCGYITREGQFIDLMEEYPDFESPSRHTQFEADHFIDEDYILTHFKWVKLTMCLDEYIYMAFEPMTNVQQEKLIELEYEIENEDI